LVSPGEVEAQLPVAAFLVADAIHNGGSLEDAFDTIHVLMARIRWKAVEDCAFSIR
jgi:hypothetical protein